MDDTEKDNAEMRLADVITSMTYGELQGIAMRLRDISMDRRSEGESFEETQEWMSLLHDWADSTIQECDS